MDTEDLEALDLLHYSTVDVNGGMLSPPFPGIDDQLHCLTEDEGEVVLAPHCQVFDLLPIGRLIINSDQVYHRCVISKLNGGVGVVRSRE
jgi:hypothetical protein